MVELQVYDEMSWEKWHATYRKGIRVAVMWNRIRKKKPRMIKLDWNWYQSKKNFALAYHPWYTGGDYATGKAKRVQLGSTSAMIRVPSLRHPKGWLVLDGNHRIKDIRPDTLILDYIILSKKEVDVCCRDFQGKFWREL